MGSILRIFSCRTWRQTVWKCKRRALKIMANKKKGQKRKIEKAVIENEKDEEIVFNKNKKAKLDNEVDVEIEEENEYKPRRSPNGYILADKLPEGLIVTDLRKQQWRLGKSVGLGGFGEIYSAAFLNGRGNWSEENYVVKVEPHTNGPLFVELHFYCRATKKEQIEDFRIEKKMGHLGIPDLKGCGSFLFRNKRLRFIVMPKYGDDLQNVLEQKEKSEGNPNLSVEEASDIALQVIDAYEYLHTQGYVHKDLKGSNLLFEKDLDTDKNDNIPSRKRTRRNSKESENNANARKKVFLVDYGLASRYNYLGFHKPFEPDQRSAHEGTLEYTSRDAHLGCVSRRGDFEVLLYTLIDWLGGKLPWDTEESMKPPAIQQLKIEAFHDIKEFLAKAFKDKPYPTFLEDIMYTVKSLTFEETPDYNYFRSLFKPYTQVEINYNNDTDEETEVTIAKPMMRKPSKRRSLPTNKKARQQQNCDTSQPWTWMQMESYNEKKYGIMRQISEDSLTNPTPAMLEQLARMQKRRKGSPTITSTTRRKGLVAKRRLSSRAPIEGSETSPERKGNKGLFNLDKGGDTPSRQLRSSPGFLGLDGKIFRRSPRTPKQEKTIGKHFFGLVKSALSSFFKQEE